MPYRSIPFQTSRAVKNILYDRSRVIDVVICLVAECLRRLYVLIRLFRACAEAHFDVMFYPKHPNFLMLKSPEEIAANKTFFLVICRLPMLVVWFRHLFLLLPPRGSLFCRVVLYFAVRFFILPWDSSFCREILNLAVTFLLFAVRFFNLPWHFWAIVGFCRVDHQNAKTVRLASCEAKFTNFAVTVTAPLFETLSRRGQNIPYILYMQ